MKVRCSATTARGEPCRQWAVHGGDKCVAHLGRVGRTTKLSDELVEELVQLLNAGNYIGVACAAVGLSRRTFQVWMERGANESEGALHAFRTKIEQSLARGEARNVAQIANAARANWQAAAWLLERQHPERWGRTSVRLRDEQLSDADLEAALTAPDDPFKEVDELAERRRSRTV